jgi:glycosyltransferase involved in cell wall biosynthesis
MDVVYYLNIDKIDVVIPTLGKPNSDLMNVLQHMPRIGDIFVTRNRPLSIARKRAVLRANTPWVAMIDDDVILPKDWIVKVTSKIAPKIGAIATVALQKNSHVAAYDKVVSNFVKLNKIDTSPHINNVILRRKLLEKYNPPPLFFGEDHHLKKFIEKSGYIWKVIPPIGAIHLGSSKNHLSLGIAYRRYGHYSILQIVRRVIARFVFTPYAAFINNNITTLVYLNRINVEFIAGWIKEFIGIK